VFRAHGAAPGGLGVAWGRRPRLHTSPGKKFAADLSSIASASEYWPAMAGQ